MAPLFSLIPSASAQTVTPKGLLGAVARQANLEGRVLWMDGTANLELLNSRVRVAAIMEKCRRANINTVVLDVKPLSGHALWASRLAPRLKEWRGKPYPEDFDLLQVAIEEAHRRGLKLHAAINVFSEGHKTYKTGPAYSRPAWQATVYELERTLVAADGSRWPVLLARNVGPAAGELALFDNDFGSRRAVSAEEAVCVVIGERVTAVLDGAVAAAEGVPIPNDGYLLVGRGESATWMLEHVSVGDTAMFEGKDRLLPIAEAPSEAVALFLNPAHPEVRAYELGLVNEICSNYEIDGFVFDRMRFSGITTDFSEVSRRQFEAWLGKTLERFPADVIQLDPSPVKPPIPGKYYREWLEWRARIIKDWLRDATAIVRYKRRTAVCGVYVGSWYASYYGVGVNWGGEDYAPNPLFDWMTPSYRTTGYAGLLDYLTTGCYYKVPTREDARAAGLDEKGTVQAGAEQSVTATNNSAFVYAGIYLLDYRDRPEEFRKAIRAAQAWSQGVMLFDLHYLEQYGWWDILYEQFSEPRRAPHEVADLLPALRQTHRALAAAAAASSAPQPMQTAAVEMKER
jgi:uncharacterized lipoprotein YddW (UPF0748 family)